MSRAASLARQLQAESKYVLLISKTAFLEGDDESHRLLVARAEALQDEAANLLARSCASDIITTTTKRRDTIMNTSTIKGLGFQCSCIECDRVFDLTNEVDAAEWFDGHDCEVSE